MNNAYTFWINAALIQRAAENRELARNFLANARAWKPKSRKISWL